MNLWQHLSSTISQHTQQAFKISQHTSLGGGCINNAYKVSSSTKSYFVKLNQAKYESMFRAEARSLQEIASCRAIRTPQVICTGQISGPNYKHAFLVLEYLSFTGHSNAVLFAEQLAAMHRKSQPQYGFSMDNYIGSNPQSNQAMRSWPDFWHQQRLLPQLKLAEKNGYSSSLFNLTDKLLDNMHLFFSSQPIPSLCHGDLWGGNIAALQDSTVVIFDPAVYYGDRETDIAMSTLFGGFDKAFYDAYNANWPLDDGFKLRKNLYNLYHILNHLNLFGDSYLGQSISMCEMLLAEI